MKNEKSTPITHESLINAGFVEYSDSPHIYRKKKIFLTYSGITWQICDENGYVGNEGNYRDIEEVIARAKEHNLI